MNWRISIGPLATLTALACPASADPPSAPPEPRLAVAEAERPLTLPHLILAPDLSLGVQHGGSTFGDLGLDLSFGITDDFSVRAFVLPLQLAGPPGDGFHYGQSDGTRGPSVGASYRFTRRVVELALGLDARVFTSEDVTGFVFIPDAQVRVHAGRKLRFDAQVSVHFAHSTTELPAPVGVNSPAAYSLQAPVTALYSITELFHVGLNSGVNINNLAKAGTNTSIPLGVLAGVTIPGQPGPLVDIDPYFSFSTFLAPGLTPISYPAYYTVGLNLTGYLYY